MNLLKLNFLFISLFWMLISRSSAQGSTDLVLTGSNSWIFHTPDDGRTSLYIAPKSNEDWNWGLYRFDNNGLLVTQSLNTNALAVNGNIKAKEIKVTTTAAEWPDYVFKTDYNLRSLSKTEEFIKENGHLPEVPKASEMEKNGVSLGEMNKILLKKIEEMTLHLIEKDKIINQVIERLEKLEAAK